MSLVQVIDHAAMLPAYVAVVTAVAVLLADLLVARWGATVATAAVGALATAGTAIWVGRGGDRATFCVETGCSYVFGDRAALVALLFGLLTCGVLALSVPLLRDAAVPAGEYCFLLACSMTGGVLLGAAGDLITLIVALETLTLPIYVLVASRRESRAGAEAALTFFVVSVVATAVTLLGAALLYAATGALHLTRLAEVFAADGDDLTAVPLVPAAVALVLLGLAFKVAAVPMHAWAPKTYDGAPVPVAAYLSTASKLGGVVALLAVAGPALGSVADSGVSAGSVLPAEVTGPVLAIVAVLTMTVGNLVALRQRRMIRLLAWSSVAQAGYVLAPLGALALAAGRTPSAQAAAVGAALAYVVFFVLLELVVYASVVALRPAGADGGALDAYRGAGRRQPLIGAALVLGLVGLAGLPPGLAGLFAKVGVVRSLLAGEAAWLALVVAVNAVIGLAYYLRVAALLYAPAEPGLDRTDADRADADRAGLAAGPAGVAGVRPSRVVLVALVVAVAVAVVAGFAPQLVFDATALR